VKSACIQGFQHLFPFRLTFQQQRSFSPVTYDTIRQIFLARPRGEQIQGLHEPLFFLSQYLRIFAIFFLWKDFHNSYQDLKSLAFFPLPGKTCNPLIGGFGVSGESPLLFVPPPWIFRIPFFP